VIWKRLYKAESSRKGGTMKQLQTLINRTNLKSSPKANMNAAEDFMEVVTTGHVIAPAMKFFDMSTME